MSQTFEYLKNNWIAIAALIVAFLSWITSSMVRKDTNRIKLAEKRYDLRTLLSNGRIENFYMLNAIHSIQEFLEGDIEFIKQQISKNKEPSENWHDLFEMAKNLYASINESVDGINAVQKSLDIIYTEMLDSDKYKTPSDYIELTGRIDEAMGPIPNIKKNIEKISEIAKSTHIELIKIPL